MLQELVGGRHDVVGALEDDVALRVLKGRVLLLVERVGYLAGIVPLMRGEAAGDEAVPEPVRVERRHGSAADAQAIAIDEVVRDDGVDGAEIELAGSCRRSCFKIVLDEDFQARDEPSEAFGLLHAVDERLHSRLAAGELDGAVLVPEVLAAHRCAGLVLDFRFTLEELCLNGFEVVVAQAGVAHDKEFLQQSAQRELRPHVVDREHPFAVVESGELLREMHLLNEVDVALMRNGELAALDVQ